MKLVETLLFTATNEAIERFEKHFYSADTVIKAIKLQNLVTTQLDRKVNDIYSDLYGASRLGFVTEEEVKECIKSCDNIVSNVIRGFKNQIEEKFGEKETYIGHEMYFYGKSYEEAEEFWNYLYSL